MEVLYNARTYNQAEYHDEEKTTAADRRGRFSLCRYSGQIEHPLFLARLERMACGVAVRREARCVE
jgi:hypothetical protein